MLPHAARPRVLGSACALALALLAGCTTVEHGPTAPQPGLALTTPGLDLSEGTELARERVSTLRELSDPRFAASARALVDADPVLAHRLFFELGDPVLHAALLNGFQAAGEGLYLESERVRRLHPARYHAAVADLLQARDTVRQDPHAARTILERIEFEGFEDTLQETEWALLDAAVAFADGERPAPVSGGTRAQHAWSAWIALCLSLRTDGWDLDAWRACVETVQTVNASLLAERCEALREWHASEASATDREWLVWLSERALARGATLSALRFVQRAAQLEAATREQRVHLALLRSRCLRKAGRLTAAEAPLADARALAETAAERGAVDAEAGRVLLAQGDEDAAEAFARAASAALEANDPHTANLRALDRCSALLRSYDLDAAEAALPRETRGEVGIRASALRALLDLARDGDSVKAGERLAKAASQAWTVGKPKLARYCLKLRERILRAT